MIDLLHQHKDQLAELCRQYRVAQLDVFGSAAVGPFDDQRSDLDFLVNFQEDFPGGPFRQYFDFLAALQALFGREVDLVESQAIRNPYFAQSVRKTRRVLYAA